jgi:hypothetical protein
MLSKCANRTCPNIFRYLHEGRLYVVASRESLAGRKPKHSNNYGQLEYAWLCSSCSFYLTVKIGEDLETRVVGKVEETNGSNLAHGPITTQI